MVYCDIRCRFLTWFDKMDYHSPLPIWLDRTRKSEGPSEERRGSWTRSQCPFLSSLKTRRDPFHCGASEHKHLSYSTCRASRKQHTIIVLIWV